MDGLVMIGGWTSLYFGQFDIATELGRMMP